MAHSKQVALRSEAVASVDPDQTLKASKALLSYLKKASMVKAAKADKNNLLADSDDEALTRETPIWLTLTTKRHIVDSNRLKPGKISLPHPLNTDPEVRVCLISADPQRAYKNLVAAADFPGELRPRVTRVIDLTHLKSKFKTYETQRALFAEHDVFLGDNRIINRLPKALGKTFYKSTAKRPIPVDIQKRVAKVDGKKSKKGQDEINACTPIELAAEIEKAAGAALVNLSPSTNTAIRIGYASWSAQQIAENVTTVANALVEKYVPQKWNNIRSIYIKGPETSALPVWLTNELWLEEADIVANGSEEAKALTAAEKPNIGKKRKSLEGQVEETAPAPKKTKKAKASKLPERNDNKLDKEIAERKAKLKKQKAAAKKALDV